MPPNPIAKSEKLERAEQKLALAQRELRRARSAIQKQERADEARRKIIGGSITETHALRNVGSEWSNTYIAVIKKSVLPKDRWLFAPIFRALLPAAEAQALLADCPVPDKPGLNGQGSSGDDEVQAAE